MKDTLFRLWKPIISLHRDSSHICNEVEVKGYPAVTAWWCWTTSGWWAKAYDTFLDPHTGLDFILKRASTVALNGKYIYKYYLSQLLTSITPLHTPHYPAHFWIYLHALPSFLCFNIIHTHITEKPNIWIYTQLVKLCDCWYMWHYMIADLCDATSSTLCDALSSHHRENGKIENGRGLVAL